MKTYDVQGWTRHELRVAYFDFRVRGEGAPVVVRAVIEQWRELGGLTDDEADLWMDALQWRESGRFLPGWSVPGEMPAREVSASVGEDDWNEFLAWRKDLARRAA